MSKAEAIHNLYALCKNISFNEADEMVIHATDEEEREFIRGVMDYILQQKQKKVIDEKRF